MDKPMPIIADCDFSYNAALYQVYGGAKVTKTPRLENASGWNRFCDIDNCGKCKPQTKPDVTISLPGTPDSFTLTGSVGFTQNKTLIGSISSNGQSAGGSMQNAVAISSGGSDKVEDAGSQTEKCPTAGKNEHVYKQWRTLPCNVDFVVYGRGCYNGTINKYSVPKGNPPGTDVSRLTGFSVTVNRIQVTGGTDRCK